MNAHSPPTPGPIERRATEIEAAVRRAAERFSEIPVIETVILRFLALLGRELTALLEETLRPHGLNETDFRTLMMLFSQPNGVAHPSDLCAYVAQSPANMTRVADGLYARGLITRVASEEDRRRTILRITPAGEALALALLPDFAASNKAIFSDMPAATRKQLLEQLRQTIVKVDQCAQRPESAKAEGGAG